LRSRIRPGGLPRASAYTTEVEFLFIAGVVATVATLLIPSNRDGRCGTGATWPHAAGPSSALNVARERIKRKATAMAIAAATETSFAEEVETEPDLELHLRGRSCRCPAANVKGLPRRGPDQ
jgi:hypothetical protein